MALASVLVCAGRGPLAAQPARVLLIEPAEVRVGLRANLSVQLSGMAELEVRPSPTRSTTAAGLIDGATALARAEAALAVIWIDPPLARSDGTRDVMLYVVGERAGRALVEVVHVPGHEGPELDRALALKVREVVAALREAQARAPAPSLLLSPPPSAATARAPVEARPSDASADSTATPREATTPSGWGLTLYFGPQLAAQPELARFGAALGGGPRLALAGCALAATLALDWFPEVERRRDARELHLSELTPKLRLELELPLPPLRLGVHAGAALSALDATGTLVTSESAPTLQGSDSLLLVAGLFGFTAELPLGRTLWLRTRTELQFYARRQSLAVGGETLIDLGRVRAQLGLELVWRSLP